MRAVGIDVDGVVANFVESLVETFELDLNPEYLDEWDIFSFISPSEAHNIKKELKKHYFWENINPYPYVEDFIKMFVDREVDIVFVTSPWTSCLGWESIRRDWIKKHIGDYPVIIAEDKRYTHVDAFLDDKPEHVINFNEYNKKTSAFGYLIDRPYNREEDTTRISLEKHFIKNSWEDLFWEIENRRLRMVSMGIR